MNDFAAFIYGFQFHYDLILLVHVKNTMPLIIKFQFHYDLILLIFT